MAINTSAKIKNYGSVLRFTERLLALQPSSDMVQLAETASRVSRARGGQDAVQLQYAPLHPEICAGSLTPLYSNNATVTIVWCRACESKYHAQFAGQACRVCQQGSLLDYPVLSGYGLTGKSHSLSGTHAPPPQPQQDDWTEDELAIYDELERSLGLSPTTARK